MIMTEIVALMNEMGKKAHLAANQLAITPVETKTAALKAMADEIKASAADIMMANAQDLAAAKQNSLPRAMLDRLKLDEFGIAAIVDSIRMISELRDPVGEVIAAWDRPNGLFIERVRTPLGVLGVIFESRPNVTADAAALAIRSGNVVIMRGGSDSYFSCQAIHRAIVSGLMMAGLPAESVQLVATKDRAAVGEMLRGLDGNIDVIIPRGGKSLIARVQKEARVPVFAHLEGLCHIYVDQSADLDMATEVVVNSKLRRTGVCGAAETLLLDRHNGKRLVDAILPELARRGCEIRATDEIRMIFPDAKPATPQDWQTEYLDAILSVQFVDGIEGAIQHIKQYSSNHTEAILAENPAVVDKFFSELDSAILVHNASTQFADGGEFGFGAEIGIATGKMHARGPIGVEQLTSFQYRVHGKGQTRR